MDSKVGVIAAKPIRPYSRLMCTISLFFQVNLRFCLAGFFWLLREVNFAMSIMINELT